MFTSSSAVTDVFSAGDQYGFLILVGMVIAITGGVIQDLAPRVRRIVGIAIAVIGLLTIIVGYAGATSPENLSNAYSSTQQQ